MADLRALMAELGLAAPRTLLQTGNLLFASERQPSELEALLEGALAERLDLRTQVFVRTQAEWAALVAANPMAEAAAADPSHFLVMALKDAPGGEAVRSLAAAVRGPEQVRVEGRQLYAAYPDGIARSKLTGALIERRLGTAGTARNWNSVLRIEAGLAEAG